MSAASGGQDIAIFNASLGTPVALPASVNTASGFERHPSISSDGRRLVFERLAGGPSQRLIAADLTTGQTADLFTGFEISESPIFGSSITPDGSTIATGWNLRLFFSFQFPVVTLSAFSSFPLGPYTRTHADAAVPRPHHSGLRTGQGRRDGGRR